MKTKLKVPMQTCPNCGHQFDGATWHNSDAEEHSQAPGDFVVCVRCSELLRFRSDMKPAIANPADYLDLTTEPGAYEAVIKLQRDVRAFNQSDRN